MAKRMRDPAPEGMKTCRKCLVAKPREAFYVDKRNRDGLTSRCKDCVRTDNRVVYAADPEKFRQRQRDLRADPAYRAKVYAASAAWSKRNRSRVTATERRRRHADPERTRELGAANAYRLRWRKHPAWLEDVERKVVLERDKGICGICGELVDPRHYDVDHILPVALGGKHEYANVQVAHPVCNREKGARVRAAI